MNLGGKNGINLQGLTDSNNSNSPLTKSNNYDLIVKNALILILQNDS